MKPNEVAMKVVESKESTGSGRPGRRTREILAALMVGALVFWSQVASADDLTGSFQFLCASVQATEEQIENFKKAFSVCLEAKKYIVKF